MPTTTTDISPELLRQKLLAGDVPTPWKEVYGWEISELTDRQFKEMFFPNQSFFTSKKATEYLVDAVQKHQDPTVGNILEVGAGAGHLSRVIAKSGIERILGIDIDPAAITCAEAIAEAEGLKIDYRVSNFITDTQLEVGGSQVIILNSVLEHIVEYKEWIHRISELLAPGGVVLIVVPSKFGGFSLTHDFNWRKLKWKAQEYNYHPGQHVNHFKYSGLKREFAEADLQLISTKKYQAFLAFYAWVLHKLRIRKFAAPISYFDFAISKILPPDIATRLLVFKKDLNRRTKVISTACQPSSNGSLNLDHVPITVESIS